MVCVLLFFVCLFFSCVEYQNPFPLCPVFQTPADGDLRLTDGADASEGRLEVYFDSE